MKKCFTEDILRDHQFRHLADVLIRESAHSFTEQNYKYSVVRRFTVNLVNPDDPEEVSL